MGSSGTSSAPSACVYPEYLQDRHRRRAPAEEDAYPAKPQDAYGWEKLVTERLCLLLRGGVRLRDADRPLPQHLSGPTGPTTAAARRCPRRFAARWRWPSPADSIEIWGDGEQTRSFCYVDDCVEGHPPDHAVGVLLAPQPRHRPDGQRQPARTDHHRHLGQAEDRDRARRRARRACADATRTTPGCVRSSGGSRESRSKRGSCRPTGGSRSR